MAASKALGGRRRVPYSVRIRNGFAFCRRFPIDALPYVKRDFYFLLLQARDDESAKREVQTAVIAFDEFVDRL